MDSVCPPDWLNGNYWHLVDDDKIRPHLKSPRHSKQIIIIKEDYTAPRMRRWGSWRPHLLVWRREEAVASVAKAGRVCRVLHPLDGDERLREITNFKVSSRFVSLFPQRRRLRSLWKFCHVCWFSSSFLHSSSWLQYSRASCPGWWWWSQRERSRAALPASRDFWLCVYCYCLNGPCCCGWLGSWLMLIRRRLPLVLHPASNDRHDTTSLRQIWFSLSVWVGVEHE